MKLLVRNLDRAITEQELRALFEPHGSVQSCTLVMDIDSGESKGFGFVVMPKRGNGNGAMKALNRMVVAGSKIRVKEAVPAPEDVGDEVSPADD